MDSFYRQYQLAVNQDTVIQFQHFLCKYLCVPERVIDLRDGYLICSMLDSLVAYQARLGTATGTMQMSIEADVDIWGLVNFEGMTFALQLETRMSEGEKAPEVCHRVHLFRPNPECLGVRFGADKNLTPVECLSIMVLVLFFFGRSASVECIYADPSSGSCKWESISAYAEVRHLLEFM